METRVGHQAPPSGPELDTIASGRLSFILPSGRKIHCWLATTAPQAKVTRKVV
ncbi:hypothetical protein ZHAS_00001855 [Anopheles sinensis]|uniref:Uncharacterized protein n=1 Tax=Anopheles sinensis TaxID=74873 RepID=A0A084VBL5_ANOSI|nr:hypothetical protein ZHAS_00001855 [Anopheles sinensis]